ncbi:DUF746 domain-containing protein [Cupriavidus basilensis]|uniref:DUF746 domain-containing protein n=1 Tax=Cupriavidus basilensis TaxID=68895 RepID=UPI0020C5DDF8|nr:DUF746 domain-containing protein [Cupriavidus basilensis]
MTSSPSGHHRQFDATLPLNTRHMAYPDSEDRELTAYLEGLLLAYHSLSPTPVPPCPACGSHNTRYHCRPHGVVLLPLFQCRDCKRYYNRRSGTPLAFLRHAKKMPAFIRLLSQQISMEEAQLRLRMDYAGVANWLARFRELLLLHDPSGKWEARVRLGIKFQFVGQCLRCPYAGAFGHGGVALSGERQAICPDCGHGFPVQLLSSEGTKPDVKIVHDPITAAWRRRGVMTPDKAAPVADQAGLAKLPVRHAALPVVPPTLPQAESASFDPQVPLKRYGGTQCITPENPRLTQFLEAAIAQAYSLDPTPPACPRCASRRTYLCPPSSQTQAAPQFACRGCGRRYTRLTGTPLVTILRKDALACLPPPVVATAAHARRHGTPWLVGEGGDGLDSQVPRLAAAA